MNEQAILEWVNKHREKKGYKPIAKIHKGIVNKAAFGSYGSETKKYFNSSHCPIARSLSYRAEPAFVGKQTWGWHDGPISKSKAGSKKVPSFVQDFIKAFDWHELPEYESQR